MHFVELLKIFELTACNINANTLEGFILHAFGPMQEKMASNVMVDENNNIYIYIYIYIYIFLYIYLHTYWGMNQLMGLFLSSYLS